MRKSILFLFFTLLFVFCNKKADKVCLVKEFYGVLNNADYSKINSIISDSLISKEISYQKVFSKEEFIGFLKWDAAFKPNYEILKIEKKEGFVKVLVSQNDERILFLNESPIVSNQIIRFKNNKIFNIELVEYITFNDSLFVSNREKFLNWIKGNHPEMKSFIHDQTESGALNYLKAIKLYKNAN